MTATVGFTPTAPGITIDGAADVVVRVDVVEPGIDTPNPEDDCCPPLLEPTDVEEACR